MWPFVLIPISPLACIDSHITTYISAHIATCINAHITTCINVHIATYIRPNAHITTCINAHITTFINAHIATYIYVYIAIYHQSSPFTSHNKHNANVTYSIGSHVFTTSYSYLLVHELYITTLALITINHIITIYSPSARELFGTILGAKVELYYSLGIPIDKTKMHNGHPRCVAQVSYRPFMFDQEKNLWKKADVVAMVDSIGCGA